MSKNILRNSKSAYLRQHASQPVHWRPWGQEAFNIATEENKPVLLSIGYSSCHWCHKMHESFEDQETASYLNENFICIKVDKEEYPDIDQYYQVACQLFSQTGGWPLNAFLMPDTKAFFVGTYFPKDSKQGRIGFSDLLKEIKKNYEHNFANTKGQAQSLAEAISMGMDKTNEQFPEGEFPGPNNVMKAIEEFFDKEFGGFGQSPKFPQFSFYEWAMDMMAEGHMEEEFGLHIIKSLSHYICGGVFDQIRGGVHRYSTDRLWLVPHFEKMLYDQAGLLICLTKLANFRPHPHLHYKIEQTLDYLSKEMKSDENYFFASQDAEADGEEGEYFTFTQNEFTEALESLPKQEIEQAKKLFQITEQGNFKNKLNILSFSPALLETRDDQTEFTKKITNLLYEERKVRIPPQTDTKGVASWNFQILSALCVVAQRSPWQDLSQKAEKLLNECFDSINNYFVSTDKNFIQHSSTLNHKLSYLEDQVFYIESLFNHYQLTGSEKSKNSLLVLMERTISEFIDENKIYTRSRQTKVWAAYPNIEHAIFDQSFKSAAATLIGLIRKLHLITLKESYLDLGKKLMEEYKGIILKNPINSGEALKSYSYPWQAYFIVKIPKEYLSKPDFKKVQRFSPARMLFEYVDEKNWQICNNGECKDTGDSVSSLLSTLGIK